MLSKEKDDWMWVPVCPICNRLYVKWEYSVCKDCLKYVDSHESTLDEILGLEP